MITFKEKPDKEEAIFELLHPIVRKWFQEKFKNFSLPQQFSILDIHSRNNILVSAPTGSGKTLTAFLAILNELIDSHEKGILKDKVYAIYISPLKALNNDISINLKQPLEEIEQLLGKKLNIRVAVRTGDTTPKEKAAMLKKPPHILVTTPESLALCLSSYKFIEHLKQVEWAVIDEIHSLAENKRGVHLTISLERLQNLSQGMCRVGLSATVSPLEEIAGFLVGSERSCKIVDIKFLKELDLKVLSPVPDLINISYNQIHDELYKLLDKLIQEHKTTLIFTNTRSATERVVHHLKERFPKNYTENIGAHHGSLSKQHRHELEDNLRKGKLKCVVCSTSLELGIDIGYVDLVICIGSPKSVARMLQRCLPYNSKVLLADGSYREIGEIVENRLDVKILSYDKSKGFIVNKIYKYHKNKVNWLFKIKLHSGLEIKSTEEHPFMTRRGWKKVSALKEGDEVAEIFNFDNNRTPYIYEMIDQNEFYVENRNDFLRNVVDKYIKDKKISYSKLANFVGIKQNHLQNYIRERGRRKGIRLDLFLNIMRICNINKKIYLPYLKELKSKSHHRLPLPLKLNKDLMWLAGIVASDGSIVRHKEKKYYKIKIGNKDLNLIKECQKIFKDYGFESQIYKTKEKDFYALDCGSKILAKLFLSLGLKSKNKSKDLEVSNILYKMPKELLIPFIEGVIEGDGNINKSGIRIFSVSHNFLKYCIKKGKKMKQLSEKKMYFIKKEDDIDKNISWTKIKSIKKLKHNDYVYNITLSKKPNNYIINSILTHNCGRAGHKLHTKINGRIIVLDRDDLVECSVMLKNALESKIDKVHIPTNCLDVMAQQILGMSLQKVWNEDELFNLIKQSYCYKDLKRKDFDEILSYLAGEFASLEDRYIYSKLWRNENNIGKRGRSRVIYMTNIGTIPDESFITVKVNEEIIGHLDEGFLEYLKTRDIFVLGGNTYEFRFARGMVAQVLPAVGRNPTVPSWISEMLPLSFDLANEIQRFRKLMEQKFKNKYTREEIIDFINSYLYVDKNASEAIYIYFKEQFEFLEIPHETKIIIEHYIGEDEKKYSIFHTLYGRRVNDCLSRALAFAITRTQHVDVEVGISDNGFYLSSEKKMNVLKAFEMLKTENFRKVMENAIEGSEVLRRRFRHCASRALMILRNYKGRTKNVGRQQVSSMILMAAVKRINENFSILKEARREVMEDLMDIESTLKVLKRIENDEVNIKEHVTRIPSPFAFNLALRGFTDILKAEDRQEFLQNMHNMVLAKIGLNK